MIVGLLSLEGEGVRLEPLTESHMPDLAPVGKDPAVRRYLPYGGITNQHSMLHHVRLLLR